MKNIEIINLSLLLCSKPNLMNRGEETLSGATRFEETSTVNKRLARLTSVAVDEIRLILSTNQLHSYRNHGDRVSVVLLPDRENCSTRLRRDRVSAGNFLEHSLLLQASERK
ncbi:hypothetical protein CHARACLAT_033183 [Characodon lateralis]|uniref:Kinesin motor domain-containing protein n=1 Tax=Characodon lateralis TaxID=208331 RepID=A0ABU7CX87_9TELE|nr:hypothetical protein [Characodon lateralis]